MPTLQMTLLQDFLNDHQLTTYLASQLKEGKLALILGAGISVPFNLPSWTKLIEQLYISKGISRQSGNSLEREAEYLREQCFKGDTPGFLKAIHDILYQSVNITFADLRRNNTLAALGALIMSSRRGSATDVVTFNFDNILETYLKYHGFVVESVCHEIHWDQAADVTVYHPHGLIPYNFGDVGSDDVVFDQASYIAVIGKHDNPWRQLVLTVLRRKTCLFVGLSGKDVNLDSMLGETGKQHASKAECTACWGITFQEQNDPVAETLWAKRGVFYKKVGDFDNDLPQFLFGVCQRAATL